MFHVVLGVGTRHQSLGPESVDIDFARTPSKDGLYTQVDVHQSKSITR